MTLRQGQISFNDINMELRKNPTDQISLNDSALRTVFEKSGYNVDFQSGWDRGLLRWGSTGGPTRTAISNSFSTFSNGNYASITLDSNGNIYFDGPSDGGSGSGLESDTFITGGNAYLYLVRVHCDVSTGMPMIDPNGASVYPGNWSNSFALGSTRTFNIGSPDNTYQGLVEISNYSRSQLLYINYSGYISLVY